MASSIIFPLFLFLSLCQHSSSFSLSVEKLNEDIIVSSPKRTFTAGFYPVGENAYSFAIYFTQSHRNLQNATVVWMANRDQPVNGKSSTLSLLKTGNLVLTDAGQFNVWSTNTVSSKPLELNLYDTGNLILREQNISGSVLWQSFDFPTDTLLPDQTLTRFTNLVSSKSQTNYSSGFYKLFFDNDNILRLLYDSPRVSSVYWPDPWLVSYQVGRSTYNNSRIAVLDSLGEFSSSDHFTLRISDYGTVLQRRLTLDHDGSINKTGLKVANQTSSFHVPTSLSHASNTYPMSIFMDMTMGTIKITPINNDNPMEDNGLVCLRNAAKQLERSYVKGKENGSVKFFMLWFATGLGGVELVCFLLVWCFLFKNTSKHLGTDTQGNVLEAATGFRKFSYSELKQATKGFSQEIGRGGGGIVYKAVLSDNRVAAIKRLYDANQGESEFLAEVGIIGRLNHMNLIGMWGYCAEGKHRLLVYEYMENGSLAHNLSSNALDWSKRYNIALGTARGLAYLHEECLEWILHCDIKPQNILLDSDYQPKVADFGLSMLLHRNNVNKSSFSRIRGTRGYMAPEWVFNLPITSKVDVYSYGIVLLEIITGRSPTTGVQITDGTESHHERLVTWVREKKRKGSEGASWVEQIVDPALGSNYDMNRMETLATVALDCVEEEKDLRPSMSQVAERLQSHEHDL
ncbi:Serine/threonine-protein kinase, active site [Sesbania bispinosa]|nr:Serine/threonine-protein kinase, active site [Sesbania bispinosa]